MMARSTKLKFKKRGRPATGKSPAIVVRFPRDLVTTVDRWGTAAGTTRSESIRRLVRLGLTVKPKGKARG